MRYEYDNANKLNSIEITLAMGCKLDCRYCPQKLLLHNYFKDNVKRSSLMSFDDFKIILNRVKRGGTICFSGMCEPFLNPECGDMILYAYEQGFRIQLFTTLIGLNRENLEKLKGVEFDAITLHIPDEEGNSKFCLTDEYFEIVKLFQENIQISSYSCHGNIHPAVGDLVNPTIECRYTMMNRAGNLEEGLKSSPQGEIVCMVAPEGNYGNWTPEVLPDGTLLLCCMDYGMKHVLGNLIDMEVKEILEGQEYQRVQKGMQNTESDILCRKCSGAIEIENTPAYKFLQEKKNYRNNIQMDSSRRNMIRLFMESDNICVFGLGKLFWDNFFNHKWNKVLGQTCFCDNSEDLWGKTIDGIKCISPEELSRLDNVLVITHVSADKEIREQLKNYGIKKIVNIRELYQRF